MGPKDDCESWFYLLIDLMVSGGLPWRKCKLSFQKLNYKCLDHEKAEVMKCKEECRKEERSKLFYGINKCEDTLGKILDYIDSLTYSDKLNYTYIYQLVKVVSFISEERIIL
jgi:hypothetical protein